MNPKIDSLIDAPYISKEALFHGYVLGYHIGVRWNLSINGGMKNLEVCEIVKNYLTFACGVDEWFKRQILDIMRETSRADIKKATRYAFPSLFHKKRQRPLQIPSELAESDVKFDIDFINQLKEQVAIIKRGTITMESENNDMLVNLENSDGAVEVEQVNNSLNDLAKPKTPKSKTTVTLPSNVDVSELTLENFREKTGKRFRMTRLQKEQVDAGTLTRAEAFAEFLTTLENDQ